MAIEDATGGPVGTTPTRTEVLADLVRLQALSRELVGLCQESLANRGSLQGGELSSKAEESIRLVERLAGFASGERALEEYRQATRRLERLIGEVHAAGEPSQLAALEQIAVESVSDWAQAVERVLEGVLSRASP